MEGKKDGRVGRGATTEKYEEIELQDEGMEKQMKKMKEKDGEGN